MKLVIHILNYKNISIDDLLSSKYLSNIEKESFNKFSNENVKKEKIVSTIFKNKYIGEYYINEKGKPLSHNIFFNLSHSYGVIVFIMDVVPIGIDIEKIRKVDNDLISYTTDEEEKSYIVDEKTFFEIWTNKEALVKSFGSGISSKINEIPSLPINGMRNYQNKIYFNKTITYEDYIITVSREKNEEYELEITNEVF